MPIPSIRRLLRAGLPALLALASTISLADEGMWTLVEPPRERIAAATGFTPTDAWLLNLQRAATDIDASGAFVSPDGLLMTNHHVASTWIQQLSTPDRDIMTQGFLARTRADELPIPGAEVRVLWELEDVTERIRAHAKDLPPAEAQRAILGAIAALEAAERDRTGLECRVVTLFGGGVYHLHRTRVYSDVRLVFAPELQAAYFGGDTDNFEYPRFCFDVAFLRVYENDAPARVEHYLPWSEQGLSEGDPIFVVGHPGRTERQLAVSDLEFRRDVAHPARLAWLRRLESSLMLYAARSPEARLTSTDDLLAIANSRKAIGGEFRALLDPDLMDAKRAEEARLRAAIDASPSLRASAGDALASLRAASDALRPHFDRDYALTRAFRLSGLLDHANTFVTLAEDWPRTSADRRREFRDAAIPGVIHELTHAPEIVADYETFLIADGLLFLAEKFGAADPLVAALLDGKSPDARAREVVDHSRLRDASHRAALLEAGPDGLAGALADHDEPALVFARVLAPHLRAARQRAEASEAVARDAYARLAEARFAAFGRTTYPDATGTLRLSYGSVAGYEDDTTSIPAFTTIAGLFDRAARRDEREFDLPPRWAAAKDALDLATPYNFVCTADIVGGNSGSPVVNREGRIVGLIFDGNIHSLAWTYRFEQVRARAVAVDARGILEGLRAVYDARELIAELTATR